MSVEPHGSRPLASSAKLSLSEQVADWYSRYFPDATIFAVVLTLVSILLAVLFTKTTPVQAVQYFFDGFPSLFTFAFQLLFINAGALAIVELPSISRQIRQAARLVKTPMAAYLSTIVVGSVTSWLGWWVGPVVTSTMARTLGKEVKGVDYKLLAAVSYASFTIWVGGLSSTILLFVAGKNPFENLTGGLMPLSQTIFTPLNLVSTLLLTVALLVTTWWIARTKKQVVSFADVALPGAIDEEETAEAESTREQGNRSFADRVNGLRLWILSLGLVGLAYSAYFFWQKGYNGLNLNSLAFLVFFLGFALHKNALTYAQAFGKNLVSGASIAIQFPIYGGIALLLSQSGLASLMAKVLVDTATTTTFPAISFLASGFINLFIPSGGSQYTATASIILPAAKELGVDLNRAVMAITYGDSWTNLVQPFWTLLYMPILGAKTKLQPRDIMGYCLPVLIVYGVIWALSLTFLPA